MHHMGSPLMTPLHILPAVCCCLPAALQRGEDPAGVLALLVPAGLPSAPASARSSHSGSIASLAASDDVQGMEATPAAAGGAGGGGSERAVVDAENVAPLSPAGSLASVASEKAATGGKAGAAAVQPAVGVTTRRGARSRIPTLGAAGDGLTDRTNME
jgi:hypothetical protein